MRWNESIYRDVAIPITGFVKPGGKEMIAFHFDKSNSSSSDFEKKVTFDSFEADIQAAIGLKEINKNFGKNLLNQAKSIEAFSGKKNSGKQTSLRLRALLAVLNAGKKSLMQLDAYTILNNDISSLLSNY